ncbi:MAG: hypothetical protein KF764_02955 [Labilithrix sp.]|nr:hypothetical protein [Labilithrix sp.]
MITLASSGRVFQVITLKTHVPVTGCWSADVDLAPDQPGAPSIGDRASLVLPSGQTAVGTVSDKQTFGGRSSVRLTGGFTWSTPVPKQDFANPAGVVYANVLAATAAHIGEVPPIELGIPEILPEHFVRVAGPASQVFGVRPWYVGLDGVIRIGVRVPAVMPTDLVVTDYGMLTRILSATSESIIEPGTVIVDLNFDAPMYVVESDQTFGSEGSAASLRLSSEPPSGLTDGDAVARAIGEMVRAVVRAELLRAQHMTVAITNPDGTLQLAAKASSEVPNVLPVDWYSAPGYRAEIGLGTKALVVLDETGVPRAIAFDDDKPPQSITIDALTTVEVGGSNALAKMDGMAAVFAAVATAVGAAGPTGPAAKTALELALGITPGGSALSPAGLLAQLATLKTKGG